MGETLDHFDPDEMRQYGLDPDVPEDMYAWLLTEPKDADQAADYSQDVAVYGSPTPSEARYFMSQEAMRRLGATTFHSMPERKPFFPNTARESGGH